MRPDPILLRELVDASPGFGRRALPAPPSEELIRAAEARVGPLPPSYRWWLSAYGHGRAGRAEIAAIGPADAHESLTAPWRLDGDRLCFAVEPDCGDAYSFALDRAGAGEAGAGECPVVLRDGADGEEYPVAESFAGFLAVRAALLRGLREGPNPSVARLWRSTPGVLLDNGVHVYGPHLLQERNETFEVARYAPGWTLVGDDSGGDGLFMRHHGRDRASVHRLGLGAIGGDVAAAGEPVTDDLTGWLRAGAVLR
ncbi:SMI1/KNR4 family protein [Streptomyces sp. NPDC057499]|uniref:SMI1/KNR4 family protein n=1 Tax=Streptomyces sp. NPDC057499 TaxID=3346150 RepID=UPI00369FCBE7